MRKMLLLVGAMAVVVRAEAAVVRDPSGLLSQVDAFIAAGSLTDAFRSGDKATVKVLNRNCKWGCSHDPETGLGGCGSVCEKAQDLITSQVTECTAEAAMIVQGDGTETALPAEEFAAWNGNLLRRELSSLDEFLGMAGEVEITRVTPAPQKLASGKEVEALQVNGAFLVPPNRMELEYVVAAKVPGVAQLLFKKIGGTKLFRLQDYERK